MSTANVAPVTDGPRSAKQALGWSAVVETSMVNEGDNPEAHVMALKARAEQDAARSDGFLARVAKWGGVVAEKFGFGQPRTTNQIRAAQKFEEEFRALRWAFVDSASSIMECAAPTKMGEMMAQSASEFSEGVKALVAQMSAGDASKARDLLSLVERLTVEADALKAAGGALEKRAPVAASLAALDAFQFQIVPAETPTGGAPATTTTEEHDPMTTAKTAPTAAAPAQNDAETLKAVLARIETLEQENAANKARAESAEATANALKASLAEKDSEKQDAEFTAKAKALAVGDVAVVKGILKTAFSVSPEAGAALENFLKGVQAQLAKSDAVLSQQRGVGVKDAADGSEAFKSAAEEVDAKAKELMAKDATVKSLSAARKQVTDGDLALKDRWINESRSR